MICGLSSNGKPEWKKMYGDAWDSIIVVIERSKALMMPNTYRSLRGSRLAALASGTISAICYRNDKTERKAAGRISRCQPCLVGIPDVFASANLQRYGRNALR